MKNRLLVWCTIVSLLAAPPLFAEEQTVSDFDGTDESFFYQFNGTDGEGAYAGYDPAAFLGPAGKSLVITWSGVADVDDFAGGGVNLTGGASIDISAFNAIAFFIRSTGNNTKAEIQLKDSSDTAGKVKLSDYVTTVTDTWQEVIIPLYAFTRSNAALDLAQAKDFVVSADYSHGLEVQAAGEIRIDNLKFLRDGHAPARSIIYSGGDKGDTGVDDVAGDTLLWWDQAASSATSNEVRVTVSTGYAVAWVSTPGTSDSVSPGSTKYYPYQLINNGNRADRIYFSTANVTGTWGSTIFWDKDGSGTYTAGDVECLDTIGLLPGSTHHFLLAISVPAGAADGSSSQIQVTAKDAYGSGTNDNWPSATNDDTLTHSITATCAAAMISVVKSTITETNKPGASITYTMNITNNGSAAATNLQLVDVIPENVTLAGAANGAGATISYYVGGSWQGYAATATRIRWVWPTVNNGSSVSGSYSATIK